MRDLKELKVWQRAHVLALAPYAATKEFPGDERSGMTSRIRRACAAIPANIAEGCGRDSDLNFGRYTHYR